MNKYIIEYQGEDNDILFTREIEIEANDSVEAIKKFFDTSPNYRIIRKIRELC